MITASAGEQTIGASPAIKPRCELTIDGASENGVITGFAVQAQGSAIPSTTPKAVIALSTAKQLVIPAAGDQRVVAILTK